MPLAGVPEQWETGVGKLRKQGEGRPAFRDVGTSHRLCEFSSGQSTQQNRVTLSSQGPFLISQKQSHLSSFGASVASSHTLKIRKYSQTAGASRAWLNHSLLPYSTWLWALIFSWQTGVNFTSFLYFHYFLSNATNLSKFGATSAQFPFLNIN